MPALHLSEDDVREVLDMEIAIEVLEQMFRELAEGRAVNQPRRRIPAPGFLLHTMSATAEYLGVAGVKSYTTTRNAARFVVLLYNLAGELVAVVDADYLGQLRTGAASGVATEFLARSDASVVGLFGAGAQARTQLKAVCTVRRVSRVEVFSRSEERCRTFCEEMSEFCRVSVVPNRWPQQVAEGKDIVITATTSKTPLFDGHGLDEGCHLNVVGSNFLNKTEVDTTTIARADARVCDSVEQCVLEAGDFVPAMEAGVLERVHLRELSDIVTGRETGRANVGDITLFKSVGLAIEDVALAARAVDLARSAGLGRSLPF
jgi:alanine dehydrogenase